MKVNIKSAKYCAFCKYWYDPTQSCITPKNPRINIWEYDTGAKNLCLQKNLKIAANHVACNKYECKVNII